MSSMRGRIWGKNSSPWKVLAESQVLVTNMLQCSLFSVLKEGRKWQPLFIISVSLLLSRKCYSSQISIIFW